MYCSLTTSECACALARGSDKSDADGMGSSSSVIADAKRGEREKCISN